MGVNNYNWNLRRKPGQVQGMTPDLTSTAGNPATFDPSTLGTGGPMVPKESHYQDLTPNLPGEQAQPAGRSAFEDDLAGRGTFYHPPGTLPMPTGNPATFGAPLYHPRDEFPPATGTDVYTNEILTRLDQLRQPINDPVKPLYDKMSLDRIANLGGDPYTSGEDAALRAKYMSPLTEARDAALTRNREQMGARNLLPSSGLRFAQDNTIEGNYEHAVAGGSNDLAVRAIDEKQKRQREQLDVLTNMLGMNRTGRAEDTLQFQDLLQTAKRLPELDQQTLDYLLRAAGDPGSANTTLGQLTGATQTNQINQQNQNQQNAQMWGQIIASIIGGM